MKIPSVARSLMLVGLAWPGMAHAADCAEWNPELVAVPSSTIGSKAVTLAAGAGPTACDNNDEDWTGTHHWDGTGGPTDDCIENLSAFVKLTPIAGGAKEGVFFRLLDTDLSACTTGLDTPSDDGAPNDSAIVFAQLVNG